MFILCAHHFGCFQKLALDISFISLPQTNRLYRAFPRQDFPCVFYSSHWSLRNTEPVRAGERARVSVCMCVCAGTRASHVFVCIDCPMSVCVRA